MNTDAPWPDLDEAEAAGTGDPDQAAPMGTDDPDRRFDDLYNLVCDPAFLVVAWAAGPGQPRGTVGRSGRRETSLHRLRRARHSSPELRADLKARQVRAAARAGDG